jgi:NhaP-type Na+/H+ or K+/H+ antiporter
VHHSAADPAVAVALAMAAGMVAQSVARHLRLPSIVLLLAAGVALGPDVAGLVRPGSLGPALQVLVGFAVSVILFEGGLSLGLKRLQRQARVIRLLITLGAAITAVGGTLAARLLMGWDWRLSVSFGVLVVVTGPTVITPLLRRIKVTHKVETVLEAEAVLIDAIGAVLAVVTLEVVLNVSGSSIAEGLVGIFARLGFGAACGLAGGLLMVLLLRFRKVVPAGLENVFTLSLVVLLFQLSNLRLPESGIMTVTAAGMVVGNFRTPVKRDLMEFKEQLTVLFIGMLFVLLAADVRVASVVELGWPGVLTVAALMLLVRPLSVACCTRGSDLDARERIFLGWLAPRGVIAAAVASLFAQSLDAAGYAGGEQLRALVFTVIAGTVVIQGLSGGLVARLLGLRRPVHRGFAIFGANPLGLALGRLLREAGHELIFLERDPVACKTAQQEGFKVVYGNGLEERTRLRAQLEDRAASVATTTNQEVNLLFARSVNEECRMEHNYVACRRDRTDVSPALVRGSDAEVLFGAPRDLDLWSLRLGRGSAHVEGWRKLPVSAPAAGEPELPEDLLLPLAMRRGGRTFPANSRDVPRKADLVHFAVSTSRTDEAHAWLLAHDWTRDDGGKVEAVADGVAVERDAEPVPVG